MEVYLAQLVLVPYTFQPKGYAFCQGQLLSISQNTALFALIGSNFGGNGQSNFALPDLRGRSPLSAGNGPGLSPYLLGEASGSESVTLTIQTIPPHTHPINVYSSDADAASPANAILATDPKLFGPGNANLDQTLSANAISPFAGSPGPHTNLMPYLTLNWIIALQGIFPQRP
jgi:microcystin-dependent protein